MPCSNHIHFSSVFLSRRSPALLFLALVTASASLVAMSGCAQILGIDDLPDQDGGVVPPPDAEPLDPGEFGVSGVEPFSIQEGEGAAWPVPIIVTGQEFTPDTTIVLDGAGFSQQEITPVVASDGKSLAFPLRVPVLTDTGKGETAFIFVRVRKGSLSAMTQLAVTGLDELTISSLGSGPLSAANFDPPYSRIVIDQDVVLTGGDAVRLVATAEIQLNAAISANGQDAQSTVPGQGGPGGCPGGDLEEAGGCGAGGGGGAAGDDAAGGGGHFTIGTSGVGDPPAPGGIGTGRPDMVPFQNEAGNGGGGSREGAGGGGGGIVELTSHGTFVIERTGGISADGGRGGDGRCSAAAKAGSGGGGSGGAILVRAWGGFDDTNTEARMSVRGGAGGDMPPDRNCVEVGGAGSAGRVRVDTSEPGGPPAFAESSPAPFQGPLLRHIDSTGTPVPVVTRQQQITLEVFGDRDTEFTLDANGTRESFSTSNDGAATVTATLAPGRNQICVVTGSNTTLDVSEGAQCISIVSIQ
jgi:hypothetical protein